MTMATPLSEVMQRFGRRVGFLIGAAGGMTGAIVAGAGVPVAVGRPGSALRWVGVAVFVAAALWFPVGVLLSGNLDLSFTNDPEDSAWFSRITTGTAALVLGAMAWAAVTGVRRRSRKTTPGTP